MLDTVWLMFLALFILSILAGWAHESRMDRLQTEIDRLQRRCNDLERRK